MEIPPFQVHHQMNYLYEGIKMIPKVKIPRWVEIWRLIKLIHGLSLLVLAKVIFLLYILSTNMCDILVLYIICDSNPSQLLMHVWYYCSVYYLWFEPKSATCKRKIRTSATFGVFHVYLFQRIIHNTSSSRFTCLLIFDYFSHFEVGRKDSSCFRCKHIHCKS